MSNIIIYHHNLFDKVTGSSEKLLINIAIILNKTNNFNIWCLYNKNQTTFIPKNILNSKNIYLYEYECDKLISKPPWKPINLRPTLKQICNEIQPSLFICLVIDNYQWPINYLSKNIPLLLISPFGNFCSNGNLRKIYVSGQSNLNIIENSGIKNAETFFNPLKIPDLKISSPKKDVIYLGRLGRKDSFIFDPISIQAFRKIEDDFGDKVKFIYVNPCQEALDLVKSLNIKNIVFKEWLNDSEVREFYKTIDIFAHSRRDGETLGVAIGEAMLHECVIVTHKSAFFNEHLFLVKEPFGLISKLNNYNHYYENLKTFITQKNKLAKFGLAARNHALNYFDWDLVSKKIIYDCEELVKYKNKPLPFKTQLIHKSLQKKLLIKKTLTKFKKKAFHYSHEI